MKSHFFEIAFWLFLLDFLVGVQCLFAQKQDFESNFQLVSFPQEFLPGWHGNEVMATSSRIFQVAGLGIAGSKGLAVQPISTFNGKIWIRLNPSVFQNPEVEFYAKSVQNGSGTRPALVFFSWGENFESKFSEPVQIGGDAEFSNQNQEFRNYRLPIPEDLKSETEAVLAIEIRYGPGSGSAARWIMDDFLIGDLVKDETPPLVKEVKGYGENSLLVRFSEKIDPVFSTILLGYGLNGKNPEKAELMKDSLVVLTFSELLAQGEDFQISISQIPDWEGNFLQDTAVTFTFFDPTLIPNKGLVINELMPAPRADQDLPNVEYIELFHAGEYEFRMEGIKLSNSRSETVLEEFWIKPGDYLILAPENSASQLMVHGQVLPVKNWPTLLNSADQISLKSNKSQLVDQISFSSSTWGSSDLANGGFSLEVPTPGFLCDNSGMLKPSLSTLKGTPGAQNSVFDPEFEIPEPKLVSAFFSDPTEIKLIFSNPILPKLGKENVSILPYLEIDSLFFLSGIEVRISLNSPAKPNLVFLLKVNGLLDCFGKPLPNQEINLVLPEIPVNGDIIINELLFNPRTGDPKFVEIRNTSQKYLSLESWALANSTDGKNIDQIRIFGITGMILEPESYLAITTDANSLRMAYPKSSRGNFLAVSSLPSYPISGGTVFLISAKGQIEEIFSYDEELHHPLLRDPKGVSLERVSITTPTSIRSNWQSASGNEEFATPGRKNSQAISGEFETEFIKIEPEIFDPEGSSGPAFTSISYQLDQSGWVGTFKIYSAGGQLIQTLLQNQLLGTSGMLTWTGTDEEGKLVRAGYYVLIAEIYEPNGNTSLIKKAIVVATRL